MACLRLLGDPETRYREDPVRMLRAVRFAAKLGFRVASETESPIGEFAPLLADVPAGASVRGDAQAVPGRHRSRQFRKAAPVRSFWPAVSGYRHLSGRTGP